MTTNEHQDHQLKLILENDQMKAQLRAKYGDQFHYGTGEGCTPEIEHFFLKRIMEVESFKTPENKVPVHSRLRSTGFPDPNQLSAQELTEWNQQFIRELEELGLEIRFQYGPYPERTVFEFLTREAIHMPVSGNPIAGLEEMIFYEDFHPNHRAAIRQNAHRFLSGWLSRSFNMSDAEISWDCVSPDGCEFTRETVIEKLEQFMASFTGFVNEQYHILELDFVEGDGDQVGLGQVKATIRYDALLSNGDSITIEGPCSIYFEYDEDLKWWSIYYFEMPGFIW